MVFFKDPYWDLFCLYVKEHHPIYIPNSYLDDTTAIINYRNSSKLQHLMNNAFDELNEWFIANVVVNLTAQNPNDE